MSGRHSLHGMRDVIVAISLATVVAIPSQAVAEAGPGRLDSFQIRHPMATALLSTLTAGLWPSQFASDLAPPPNAYQHSWTPLQVEYLRPPAEKSFRSWRRFFAKTMVGGGLAWSLWLIYRKRRRNV